ncbi:MAG TPA: outer membrane lipid asymmetry maintenance protein MlaD [Polyangia bacterium]|jgi:phospholipid/cholesterol/gamma-HCH transport system substrate-binding protein|nr:outer membrane lipid asymmetry maintenance protein MlaD [Polyangia bacterium]
MIEQRTPLFDYTRAEIVAGIFVLVGLGALAYLSISIGGLHVLPRQAYSVRARFSNIGDLKPHASVKIAGVTVGRVEAIRLAEFVGEAELSIDKAVRLPKDTIASITTAGLLGDAYVSLTPGGDDVDLKEGDRIAQTEPAMNMADLVGHAAFGNASAPARQDQPSKAAKPDPSNRSPSKGEPK